MDTEHMKKFLERAKNGMKESKNLDFKERINTESNGEWCETLKDIVAMANSGGGVIVFGVKDNGEPSLFDCEKIKNFDSADITNKVESYTGRQFGNFEITTIRRQRIEKVAFLIGNIITPLVFCKAGGYLSSNGKEKIAFHKGTIYFRHGSKSEPANESDIRIIVEREVNRQRETWLGNIKKVIEAPPGSVLQVTPADVLGGDVSLKEFLKISEQGRSVKLTNDDIEKIKKSYPNSYAEILEGCKKKRYVKQLELQKYINKCKQDQSLSINWKLVSKSLSLPFSAPDKYMYSKKVISDF